MNGINRIQKTDKQWNDGKVILREITKCHFIHKTLHFYKTTAMNEKKSTCIILIIQNDVCGRLWIRLCQAFTTESSYLFWSVPLCVLSDTYNLMEVIFLEKISVSKQQYYIKDKYAAKEQCNVLLPSASTRQNNVKKNNALLESWAILPK